MTTNNEHTYVILSDQVCHPLLSSMRVILSDQVCHPEYSGLSSCATRFVILCASEGFELKRIGDYK